MHENLHQATSREFDLGFAEIQAPDAVKRLAKKHARFLVSLHYLKLTSQSGMSKIEANAQDEAHIPQLEERSWPMYFVDNIRIRKICDVSLPTARIHESASPPLLNLRSEHSNDAGIPNDLTSTAPQEVLALEGGSGEAWKPMLKLSIGSMVHRRGARSARPATPRPRREWAFAAAR